MFFMGKGHYMNAKAMLEAIADYMDARTDCAESFELDADAEEATLSPIIKRFEAALVDQG